MGASEIVGIKSGGMILRLALALTLLSLPALAQEGQATPSIKLKSPIACTIGTECWIVRYANNAAPGTPARDFKCGMLTDAESTGTDIALRDEAAMAAGVNVLAVAEGKIINVRGDIDDTRADDAKIKALKADKKACGNGIFIDHGNGWLSAYCHLKKDSINVKKGDSVKAGAVIAQAGQSGAAPMPQLHVSLFHNSKPVDPFTGLETGTGCGQDGTALWPQDGGMTYEPFAFTGGGFTGGVPDFSGLKADSSSPASLPGTDLNAFSFWTSVTGAQPGDKITLEVTRPDGTPLSRREFTQKEQRLRQFYYTGRRLKAGQLTPGDYIGTATITRALPDGVNAAKTITKTIKID